MQRKISFAPLVPESQVDIEPETPCLSTSYIENAVMAKQSPFDLDSDADYMIYDPKSPERSLLYALLERAVHDLTSIVDSHERSQAIQWFRSRGYKAINCQFTFDQVIEYLDLSPSLLCAIERRITLAESYQRVSDQKTREKIKIEIDKYLKARGRKRGFYPARATKSQPIKPEVNFHTAVCA